MTLSQNQFAQSPTKGQMDLRYNPNTISCQVKSDEATALVPGQCVKIVDSAGGVPKVTAATVNTDDVFGIVAYSNKQSSFAAGDAVEISFFRGNVMYMEASAAIARGEKVSPVITGSKIVGHSGALRVIGRALDKAALDGDLIRVIIDLPGGVA
jgi:hypothetical protein